MKGELLEQTFSANSPNTVVGLRIGELLEML
jgi:hypothetical protein